MENDCASFDAGSAAAGEAVPTHLSALGTLLVIGASFVSCFGLNLQKMAHNQRAALPVSQRKSVYTSCRWWSGLSAMVCGSLMDVVALPLVPLSRVAALGSSSLVANILITPVFLKERVHTHDVLGCVVAVVGTSVACYFGAAREPQLDGDCLLKYLAEPLFLAYLSFVVLGLCVMAFLIEGFRRKQKAAELAGLVGGVGQPASLECVWAHDNLVAVGQVIDDKTFPYVTRCGPQFYPTVHAAFAGTLGAQSIMLAKGSLVFVSQLVARRGAQAGSAELANSLGLLICFLVPTGLCLWAQIHYLNEALRIYCDAIFVLPVYQAFWVTAGIASGLVFYQEYRRVPQRHIAFFCLGVLTCLTGLFVLSRRKSRPRSSRGLSSVLVEAGVLAKGNAKDSDTENSPMGERSEDLGAVSGGGVEDAGPVIAVTEVRESSRRSRSAAGNVALNRASD
eukprot:Hpha_TRINITY_DN5047_c0_g1::TRINITY_DN5047_c0_g1_i1::g.93944::m.93944